MAEQTLGPTPIILALWSRRQKDHKFEARLGNIVRPFQMEEGKRRGGKERGKGEEGEWEEREWKGWIRGTVNPKSLR